MFGVDRDRWLGELNPDDRIVAPSIERGIRLSHPADEDEHGHGHGCACGACCGTDLEGGVATLAATTGELAAAAPSDLPSYDWDLAAEQIGRDERVFGGSSWGISVGSQLGRGASVTYGYLAEADASADEGGRAFRALTTAEIASVELVLDRIARVADVEFERVVGTDGVYLDDPNDAEIDFDGIVGSNGGLARTAYSGSTLLRSTVSFGEQRLEDEGSYAFRSALHEVGHALGMSHPGDYNGSAAVSYEASAEFREDSAQFSVMSYWDEAATGADYGQAYATHLMLYDIAALQRLYGVNETAQAGDDVYGTGATDAAWSTEDSAPIGAIWDTGGHDRLDGSGHAGAQHLDLREEAFSSLGGLTHNVAIARGVAIEDATGGAGDDEITGNALANMLVGGDGADLIEGGAGADVIYGDGLV